MPSLGDTGGKEYKKTLYYFTTCMSLKLFQNVFVNEEGLFEIKTPGTRGS